MFIMVLLFISYSQKIKYLMIMQLNNKLYKICVDCIINYDDENT